MKKEPLLIAFASQKGGVGKSAFTVLVASILHYQKGLKVGVVDCDSPQHSISRMRDRDIESVQESDFLKVVLYRSMNKSGTVPLSGNQKQSGESDRRPVPLHRRAGCRL